MGDSLSNMIANIKSAQTKRSLKAIVPNSSKVRGVLTLLVYLGFINSFSILNSYKIEVLVKYTEKQNPVIRNITRVSSQGNRIYFSVRSLEGFAKNNNLNNVFQVAIVTTSKGILTHKQAINNNVGGEILLTII